MSKNNSIKLAMLFATMTLAPLGLPLSDIKREKPETPQEKKPEDPNDQTYTIQENNEYRAPRETDRKFTIIYRPKKKDKE